MAARPKPTRKIPGLPASEERILSATAGPDPAVEEAIQLSSGRSERDLKAEALERDHNRAERFRDHFERIAIAGLYMIAAAFLAVGLVWLYHLLSPCPFLDDAHITKLQNIITGGVIGLVLAHLKRRIG